MSRDLRRAVLVHLKTDAGVTAFVPAASIYPATVPSSHTWPFIRWDAPSSIPVGFGCTAGEEVTFFVHCFVKDRIESGTVVETAESYCERITDAMRSALNRHQLTLAGGAVAKIRVRSIRTMMDGNEAGAWHGLCDVSARVYTS